MTFRALTFAFLSLSFSTNSWGADEPSETPSTSDLTQEGATDPVPTGDATTAESAPPDDEKKEIDWKGPLQLYDLGQVNEALEGLRVQVIDCGEPVDGKCTEAQLATLYASTAVVLAGSGDHPGGVRAFRRALTYSQVRLLPAYQTPEVERALAEAKGEVTAAAPAPPPAVNNSYPEAPEEPYVSPESGRERPSSWCPAWAREASCPMASIRWACCARPAQ